MELGSVDIPLRKIFSECLRKSDMCFQSWFSLNAEQWQPIAAGAGKLFLAFKVVPKDDWEARCQPPPIVNVDCKERDLGIFIGTMNCGNALPPSNLTAWLQCDIRKHKIVVVGLQESGDEIIWEKAILKAINRRSIEKNFYKPLAAHTLTEMRVLCFVDQHSLQRNEVCHVSMFSEATGIAGIVGNKGAVLISLDYGGTSLCFVNSHLAAHQKKEESRNSNYREICTNVDGVGNIKHPILNQFHHIFWLGDLNYRCDYKQEEDPLNTPTKNLFNEYKEVIDRGKFDGMLRSCQLIRQLKTALPTAFFGFQEAKISFQPTFKVFKNQDYEYKPKRSPSWCDRILWRSVAGYKVECIRYVNAPEICSSDHKPVYGEFSVKTWKRQPGRTDNVGNLKKAVRMIIDFKNCKAKGLRSADIGSESDPYLHFPRQELLNTHYNSRRKKDTNNPIWNDADLPHLELHRTNLKFLENALLLLQCRDFDFCKPADRLGNGYLPLKPIVEKVGNWVHFEEKLTWDGISAGTLEGDYRLRTV